MMPITQITDPLQFVRAVPDLSGKPTGTAVLTVCSEGYEQFLFGCLASFRYHNPSYSLYCVLVSREDGPGDQQIRDICATFGAKVIEAEPIGKIGSTSKSIMYSASKLISEEKIICVDADTICVSHLDSPFFLDTHDDKILIARDSWVWKNGRDTETSQLDVFLLEFGGLEPYTAGLFPQYHKSSMILNDGVMIGTRKAFDNVDRVMREYAKYYPAMAKYRRHCINQSLLNIAVLNAGIHKELHFRYNCQVKLKTLIEESNDRTLNYIGPPREAEAKKTTPGWRIGAIVHYAGGVGSKGLRIYKAYQARYEDWKEEHGI